MAFRSGGAAELQGSLLRRLSPDLLLLQEANPGSAHVLQRAAGLDWLVRAVDLRPPGPGDRPVRARGVAIAGRGEAPRRKWLPSDVALPERILLTAVQLGGGMVTAISYHAPPGVSWGIVKPRQAVSLARWLAEHSGPVLMGADANTPLVDAADFAHTRTHWHSGDRHLHGEPGDDLLFGPGKIHPLDDALRCWLAGHPGEAAGIPPAGPLAVTHRTGRRKNSPGTGRRFDSIWISAHWAVERIEHLYDDSIAAGSDHALVVADLTFSAEPLRPVVKAPLPPRSAPASLPAPPVPPRVGLPRPRRAAAYQADPEFIPGHYCRDCGWPFTASVNQTRCNVPHACQRRQALPLSTRGPGCRRNDRAHPEWLALMRQRQA